MQVSSDHTTVVNAAEFRRHLTILHQAGVGVVLCRTREPFRAHETLRLFAAGERMAYRLWTVTKGWEEFQPGQENGVADNLTDPYNALRRIEAASLGGLSVMLGLHHVVGRHPGVQQTIKDFYRLFNQDPDRRLVLLFPVGASLPPEIEDDAAILDFDTPSYAELTLTFDDLLDTLPAAKRPRFSDEDARRLVSLGGGMTAAEYETAVAKALVVYKGVLPEAPVDGFATVIAETKVEVVKRSEVLELMPAEDMANVGGLENLKGWVAKRRTAFTDAARDYGIDPPKGTALIGPPGTGKSLVAKAIATVLGIPLIRFDVGKVFGSLVGQSEQRVRAATKMIDAMSPCVALIDEVDKAFQANMGGGDSGTSQRVLGTLLTWMQETTKPVFLVATANRVNNLPSEFLRRGRLDEVFSVSLPAEDEALEILRIHLRKRGHDPDGIEGLDAVARVAVGSDLRGRYVPSEIEAAVKDALVDSFADGVPLTGGLITAQLERMVPLSEAFAEDFQAMQLWAVNNARPANAAVPGGPAPALAAGAVAVPRRRSRNVNLDS